MELDKRNIEEYINRFLEGETTNAEEQAIYRFFHTGDVPSHLMGYAPMFAWYEGGMQGEPGMSQPDGQEEVAGGKRSEKIPVVGKEGFYQRIPVTVWSAGIAAMMVIALGLGLIFYSENQAGGSGEWSCYEGSYVEVGGKRISDVKQIMPCIIETLEEAERVEKLAQERVEEICRSEKEIEDKEFIDCAPALKMIAETATGYNNIDINYAKEKNIRVANVAGYSTDSVVQHTFALGLYLIEKMNYYDNYVKSGEYAECPIFSHFSNVFHELSGKTWGIVGLGTIGKGVAKIASDFGCKVIYYSASGKTQDVPYEREEFDEFLKKSDIISIHAPLNDKTNNLFNKEAFDKMKTSTVLLNLGRGPIVNDADLTEALEQGKIAAAGLDVLGKEPIEKDNPLLRIKDSTKLVITPHVAWGTVEARTRLMDEVYENIAAFTKGEARNAVV